MLRKGRLTPLLLLFLGAGPSASGQERPAVPEFSTVRLTSPAYTGVATLVGFGTDSLELGVEGLAQPITVPIPSVTRLEYLRPATRRERATRGGLWGAGIFGVLGLAITDRGEDVSGAETVLGHALGGAVMGGTVGLLMRRYRWERVDPGPLDVRGASDDLGLSRHVRLHPSTSGAQRWRLGDLLLRL